jgi:hypothetical protein
MINNQKFIIKLQNNKIIKKIINNLKNIFEDKLIINLYNYNDKLIIHFNIFNLFIIKNNKILNSCEKKIQNEIDKIKYKYEYKILLNNIINENQNKKILNEINNLNNDLSLINNKINNLI